MQLTRDEDFERTRALLGEIFEREAAVAAAPVYELLGKQGLGVKDFPALDTKVITGDLGFHQHPGGHVSGPAWETFYTFAAKYFRK